MDEVHVSPAVFREAVNDEEHRLRFAFRKPVLVIDPVIPDALEKPLLMFHGPSSILSAGCAAQRRHSGNDRPQVSTQFRERSTARFHPRVNCSTFSLSILGKNLFATAVRWLISSTPFQQPTARPAR